MPKDLLRHKLDHLCGPSRNPVFAKSGGAVLDIAVEPGFVVPDPDVLNTMLIAGAGIGLLPDVQAADAVADLDPAK